MCSGGTGATGDAGATGATGQRNVFAAYLRAAAAAEAAAAVAPLTPSSMQTETTTEPPCVGPPGEQAPTNCYYRATTLGQPSSYMPRPLSVFAFSVTSRSSTKMDKRIELVFGMETSFHLSSSVL